MQIADSNSPGNKQNKENEKRAECDEKPKNNNKNNNGR